MIDIITLSGAMLSLFSLITYKRSGAHYDPIMSLVAYSVMLFMFYIIVFILIKGGSSCIELAIITMIFAYFLLKNNGNISKIVKYKKGIY